MNPELRRPWWIARHIAVSLLVVAFVNLGLWQLRRLHVRRASNAVIAARLEMPAVPVASILTPDARLSALRYRRVVADGTFDTAREVILPDRSFNGRAGNIVVTPLRLQGSPALIVERGWVPLEDDDPPIARATPPMSAVRIEGVLLPSQERGRFGPVIPEAGTLKVLYRIDLPRYRRQLPYEIFPMYLHLLGQQPAQTQRYPIVETLPALDEGPHLSYAIQWFAFASIAVIGYGAVIRRKLA